MIQKLMKELIQKLKETQKLVKRRNGISHD